MRYTADHKEATKRRILTAAGRGFRKTGFGALGVDGLASEAGVTSGAFYGHFRSKADAFRAAIAAGIADLRGAIEVLQTERGPGWVEALARFYFTERVTCDLAEGCALPSLSADVARSDAKTKAVFESELLTLLATIEKGLVAPDAAARAIVMAALLAGGVTLARSVRDKHLRDRIAKTVREATVAVGTPGTEVVGRAARRS